MPRVRNQSLRGRADQAGILFATANAPLAFQRTLMPRALMDQALITGLSASANHALVSMIQDSIQAAALVFVGESQRRNIVDERRWSRAAIGVDLAAIGVGIAVQAALRQRGREPLPRAAARTGGFWLAVTGTSGAIVGALQEAYAQSGRKPGRTLAVIGPAAAALAGGNTWLVRHRAHLDADLANDGKRPSLPESIGVGLGVAAAMSAAGGVERKLADVVSRSVARVLPGNEAMWRPLGHAVALAGFGYAGRALAVKMMQRIEKVQESAEAAYDIPPPNALLSGSHESLVPFDTLSRAGRRYVWMVVPQDVIEQIMDEPATAPIRAYVGLESAPSEQERVDLAIRELERTGAFDREWLMIASPTGTGYVNYAAVSILELLTRGNCATIAMQYSARPSPLSLDRVGEGRRHARMLCAAISERLAECPPGARPKVVLFGESLGAWTSQDGFVDRGTQGLLDCSIDRAIWIGTPHFSKWKERVLYDDRPDVDHDLVGVFNDIGEWTGTDSAARELIRYVMITHYDDGVGVFGPELLIQAPPWLGNPAERHASVPKAMRWMPTTTFFQVLVDMKNAANVVPGVFEAKGHDYRADLLPFFHAVLDLPATPEQLDSIKEHLVGRELFRSQWSKVHGTVDKSLSATVLARLMQEEREAGRDTDGRLLELIRAVAAEEFGASGGVAAQ